MSHLRPEDQKYYEQMKKICLKPHAPVTMNCVLLKRDLDKEAEQKKKDLANIARFALHEKQFEAFAFVTQKVNARQNEAMLLHGALMQASNDYDQILSSRAAKPIAAEILIGLAVAALPELRVIGRATKGYVGSRNWNWNAQVWPVMVKNVQQSSAPSWDTLVDEILKIAQRHEQQLTRELVQKLTPFAKSLDAAANDIIGAIRNPLKANSDLDEESSQRFGAFVAKNQLLSGIIGDIRRTLVGIWRLEPILYQFIFWYKRDDVLTLLQAAFQVAGLDEDITYSGSAFSLYSDLILYDMLRSYVKMYFVVHTVQNQGFFPHKPNVDALPSDYNEREIEGLDKSQRKMIYDKFRTVRWPADRSRPPVKDYKDLIKHWNGSLRADRPDKHRGNRNW